MSIMLPQHLRLQMKFTLLGTSGAKKLTILEGGNVGIGITSPTSYNSN